MQASIVVILEIKRIECPTQIFFLRWERKKVSFLCSVPFPQSQTDAEDEQEASAVHLSSLRSQHRPADHDPHLAQLSGGLHQ